MFRRLPIVLLALLTMLSLGGVLRGQAQAASAAECCKASCPKSQHRDPVTCCNISLAHGTAEVASATHGAPDPMRQVALNSVPYSLTTAISKTVVLEEIYPPPGHPPSPVHLCSLQI